MHFKKILQFYQTKLHREFNLTPILGCELEFYIIPKKSEKFSLLKNGWHSEIISDSYSIIKERGHTQFEIIFKSSTDILSLLEIIISAKKNITELLAQYEFDVSFNAKPFHNQPGSGLHIHLNLEHENKISTQLFRFAIGGLLQTLSDFMIFFAPTSDSYKRYMNRSMTAPNTISWGYNNRTTALRIIKDCQNVSRIEHRVAGSDADPLEVITAIICGAYTGLSNKVIPIPPIYGLAFESQYKLTLLPTNLIKAKKNFTKSKFSDMFKALI